MKSTTDFMHNGSLITGLGSIPLKVPAMPQRVKGQDPLAIVFLFYHMKNGWCPAYFVLPATSQNGRFMPY